MKTNSSGRRRKRKEEEEKTQQQNDGHLALMKYSNLLGVGGEVFVCVCECVCVCVCASARARVYFLSQVSFRAGTHKYRDIIVGMWARPPRRSSQHSHN